MADSKPTLGYWGLRGLGQPIRALAAYLGLEINEKRYSGFEQWQTDKFALGLDFPNLPYWIEGDIKVTESKAVVRHVAREHGGPVYPRTPEAVRTCDMVENLLWDLWQGLLRYCNAGEDSPKQYLENYVPKKMEYLSSYLENRKFILGDQISYVDFLLYEMFYHYTTHDPTYLDKYPVLKKYKKSFEEIPAIAAYMGSSDYIKGPCINPMAKYTF